MTNDPQAIERRLHGLNVRQQADLALRQPPERRLELLLHAPQPMRAVRALPGAEFYATVRELGPTDALPLVALGSASQLAHLLDLESWRRERFDGERAGAWIALLAEAGDPPLRRWLRNTDDEGLALLLRHWARPEPVEPGDDASPARAHARAETADERGTFTPDGAYRVRPKRSGHLPALLHLLRLFFGEDPERYMRVLNDATMDLPSALEEEALRWRQSRIEEHGYPPFEEALAIYAPPGGRAEPPVIPAPADPDGLPAPRSPLRASGGVMARLAADLDRLPEGLRERALYEIVAVANRVLVADGGDTGDPGAHRAALDKAAATVALALEARVARALSPLADVLERTPVVELFREGHARVAQARVEAERLLSAGWPRGRREALELMDPPAGQRVAALLERRPAYLELAAEGRGRLREFRTLGEIEETRAAVALTAVAGRVLVEHLGLDVERVLALEPDGAPRHLGTFLLTLLAWHAARGAWRGDPLSPAVARDFLRQVASRRAAPAGAPERALEALLRGLTARLALAEREVALLRIFGHAALERLAAECGDLDPERDIDPRFVSCLVIES